MLNCWRVIPVRDVFASRPSHNFLWCEHVWLISAPYVSIGMRPRVYMTQLGSCTFRFCEWHVCTRIWLGDYIPSKFARSNLMMRYLRKLRFEAARGRQRHPNPPLRSKFAALTRNGDHKIVVTRKASAELLESNTSEGYVCHQTVL